MSKVIPLCMLMIATALTGCEPDYESMHRRDKMMPPADPESLSREELEAICYDYLTYADAAAPARSFDIPRLYIDRELELTLERLSDPTEILAKCDELDAFINRLDLRLQEARVACGPCLGIGFKGESVRKEYAFGIANIPKWRETIRTNRARAAKITERLAEDRAITQALKTWKQSNRALLTYKDGQVELEITDMSFLPRETVSIPFSQSKTVTVDTSAARTEVNVRLTVLEGARILWPCNKQPWGYDADSPFHGGSFPIGATLCDDLGNEFPLSKFTPGYFRQSKGLRAGDGEDFTVIFQQYPADKATSLTLRFVPGVFGQDRPIEMTLPTRVFLKTRGSVKDVLPSSPESESVVSSPPGDSGTR